MKPSLRGSEILTNTFQTVSKKNCVQCNSKFIERQSSNNYTRLQKRFNQRLKKSSTGNTKLNQLKSLVSNGLSQHLFSVLSKRETREHTFKTF